MPAEKESLGSRSARTFSVLTVGRGIGLLISIITIVIIARMLGPSRYGVYTLAFAFFLFIGSTNNFGFGMYLTKHLSEYVEKGDRRSFGKALISGYFLVTLTGALLTVIGIFVSGFATSLLQASGVNYQDFVLASCTLLFFMIYGVSDYALIGLDKNTVAVVLENVENVVMLVASAVLIELGYGPYGAIAGMLISYAFAAALGTFLVFRFARKWMRRRFEMPSAGELRRALGFSLPVAVNNFLGNGIASFGTLFLGFFVSAYAVGNYGVANRSSSVFALIYSTAAVTLLPTLTIARTRRNKRSEMNKFESVYNKVLLYSIIITVPIIAYFGIFSSAIIYLLVSRNFSSAPLYLAVMALGITINLAGTYITSLFVAMNKTRQLIIYSLISTLAQFIFLIILVPSQGVIGAIIAIFLVGGIFDSYLFLRGARSVLGVKTKYRKLLLTFASNIVLALLFSLGLSFSHLSVQLVYGVIVLLLAYPLLLVLFKVMNSKDIEMVGDSVKKVPVLYSFVRPLLRYFEILDLYLR
ncbi:MAG: oligosaccharide flippase family protein [Candidatus Micrarchaeales archaeon]|jgi:O-antigen/teichoic acid export membrane protein